MATRTEYMKRWYVANRERRRAYDQSRSHLVRDTLRCMKEGVGTCKVCGRVYDTDYPGSFHWDHTDPATKTPAYRGSLFGHGMRFGILSMMLEIVTKCEMLCHECHKWKTRFDRRVV